MAEWLASPFKKSVLADALHPPKDEGVVDLLLRPLHAVGEPVNDVIGFLRVDTPHVGQFDIVALASSPCFCVGGR